MTPSPNAQKMIILSSPVLLLCEGIEDELVLRAFIARAHSETGFEKNIQILSYGGKDKLRTFLKILPATSGFANVKTIAITRDADNAPDAAQTMIDNAVKDARFPEKIKTLTFLFPGAHNTGALETLCLNAIQDATPDVCSCIKSFFDCLCSHEIVTQNETPATGAKRRIQAWLSTLPKPGLRLGEAALAKQLPFDNQNFSQLSQFLQSL